jgi:uncharacterized integral membrane protein
MIYFSVILSFAIFLCLVIVAMQNNTILEIQVMWLSFRISIPALVFLAAAAGALMVAAFGLPKLGRKTLQTRRLNKEVQRLEGLCKESGTEKKA